MKNSYVKYFLYFLFINLFILDVSFPSVAAEYKPDERRTKTQDDFSIKPPLFEILHERKVFYAGEENNLSTVDVNKEGSSTLLTRQRSDNKHAHCRLSRENKSPESEGGDVTIGDNRQYFAPRTNTSNFIPVQALDQMKAELSKFVPNEPYLDYKGKNVLITGATSGIGRALAILWWRQGINVIALGRNAPKLEELKKNYFQDKSMHNGCGNLYTILADLSKKEGQDVVIPQLLGILAEDAKLHYVLFNAAVITPLGYEAVFTSNTEEIRCTLETNAMAPVLLTNMLFPYFEKHARLLYVSSIAGERPGGGTLLYSISKALIDQLVRALRKECGLRKTTPLPLGTKINPWGNDMDLLVAGVNPGNVETPIHSRDLRGADPTAMPRVEFFQSMSGKLLTADVAAKYMDWLLTKSSREQYLQFEKHTIYDPEQWKFWNSYRIVDPYPSTVTTPSTAHLQPVTSTLSFSEALSSSQVLSTPLLPTPLLPTPYNSSPTSVKSAASSTYSEPATSLPPVSNEVISEHLAPSLMMGVFDVASRSLVQQSSSEISDNYTNM